MEENEVKVEEKNVEETQEIADKTPTESKRTPPNQKKMTWIIGSIGVFLVASLATVLIVGAVNDYQRSQRPTIYVIDWNYDLPGFYNSEDKFITSSDKNMVFEKRTDSAEREYMHLKSVGGYKNATTFVLPSTTKLEEKAYSVYSVGGEDACVIKTVDNISAIYAPSLYKEIGSYSFSNMPALTKVEFRSAPQGKQDVGDHAFSGNPLLTTVTLADNLNSLGDSAFEGCSSLTQINLSGSLSKIGKAVFKGCNMNYINFNGNKTDWDKVTKEEGWDEGISECYIQLLKETKTSPYIYIE